MIRETKKKLTHLGAVVHRVSGRDLFLRRLYGANQRGASGLSRGLRTTDCEVSAPGGRKQQDVKIKKRETKPTFLSFFRRITEAESAISFYFLLLHYTGRLLRAHLVALSRRLMRVISSNRPEAGSWAVIAVAAV